MVIRPDKNVLLCLSLSGCFLFLFPGCGSSEQRAVNLSDKVGVATPAESHQVMVNALDAIQARADDENIYVGTSMNRQVEDRYKKLSDKTPRLERWATVYARAKIELLSNNFELAFELYKEAEETIHDHTQTVNPSILNQFYFDMAIAFMRWGETQNCCKMHLPDSCILPFSSDVIHQDPVGSQEAIVWLTAVLQRTKTDDDMHLAAQWLLNVSYLTLGKYPDEVPAKYLIAGLADAVESNDFPRFKNVAEQAGVDSFSLAGGAIADDFDNDGNIDLVVSSFDPCTPLQIFWNRGDGTFESSTNTKLNQLRGGLNLVQADYNNDGLLDIFVMRGGWLAEAGKHPNSLLHNNGDRTFTDVSVRAGLEIGESHPTQAAAWADYDLDGDLDLYIGNEASSKLSAPSQLFQNQGNGTFRDIAEHMRVQNNALAKAVTWGDFDGDGDPDLFVSNYQSANRLYRNDGNKFTDVAASVGVHEPLESFPTWFCDVNNDGRLDLYVSAYSGGIAEFSAYLQKKPFAKETLSRLYIGQANGKFVESSVALGMNAPTHPMGANFGDLNNDGFVDFYLGTGWPELHEIMPNVLYRGGPDGFKDVTASSRVGHLQKGHAVAMADFDNDGDLDVFEQMGGFVPADKYYDVLYENPGTKNNHWIKIKLVGRKSNRFGIGANIAVHVVDDGKRHTIYRQVNSGGSFGANPLEQHIGLGKTKIIESIEVRWPGSQSPQQVPDARVNSRLVVKESP